MKFSGYCLAVLFFTSTVFADGPGDNLPDQVRRVPPLGIELTDEQSAQLRDGLAALKAEIDSLEKELAKKPELLRLIPDVEVFYNAVRFPFQYQEFQKGNELKVALAHLEQGKSRAAALRKGETPWLKQAGPVVRGFRSKLDGTTQPYGLEIPDSYDFANPRPNRLDFWFHGRGERTNETAFVEQRSKGAGGKIRPEHTIVLHPYARFSNANKFAGEIDCLEALEHVKEGYRIDEDRILVRGFSMGGAACWQFAVHYADRWAAAQPGAGFSETPDFLRTFQGETLNPFPWEQKLWRWYDCTDWAINLTNCPTIAYSGEEDRQIQAALMMDRAMKKNGQRLVHIIGPGMGHKFHPDSLEEIETRLNGIAKQGRRNVPKVVRFKTYTLRYPKMHWIHIDRLTEHWEPARIDAELQFPNRIFVDVTGVDRFTIEFKPGEWPLDVGRAPAVDIDGFSIKDQPVNSDLSWKATFQRDGDRWTLAGQLPESKLEKRPGLTGPIDDAFMDSFLFVTPTSSPFNETSGKWADGELQHAISHWRQQMRGDARVKTDLEINDEDIKNHNLVLWGDPSSNAILKRIIGELPLKWTADEVGLKKEGAASYNAADHSVAMVYPNPLNPEKYIVLNSGFTYREYDYLNNARQTPKLPDWAIIDLKQPVTTRYPGGIPAAGFFDEDWQVK